MSCPSTKKRITMAGIRRAVSKKPKVKVNIKTVKKIVNKAVKRAGEVKHWDIPLTALTMSSGATAFVNLLNTLPQGVTDGTRIGDKIRVLSLQIRATVSGDPLNASANKANHYRWFIVKGKKENGNVPTIDEYLQTQGTTQMLLDHRSAQKKLLTKIVDKVGVVAAGWNVAAVDLNPIGCPILIYNKIFKINQVVTFNGAATSILNGGVYLSAVSDQNANMPVLTYNIRFNYVDA